MTNLARKIRLILWKNFIIRMHHKRLTFCQLCLPFLMLGFTMLKSQLPDIQIRHIKTNTYHQPVPATTDRVYLYYAPSTDIVNGFMQQVQKKAEIFVAIKAFPSEIQLLSYLKYLLVNETYYTYNTGAVIFSDFTEPKPKSLKYTLRTEMELHIEQLYTLHPFRRKSDYMRHAFLDIQRLIDLNYIERITDKNMPMIMFQEMPHPPHAVANEISDAIYVPTVLIVGIIFILLSIDVVKRTLEEKESGMKELMKIVGMEIWMLWLGWFIYIFVLSLLVLFLLALFFTMSVGNYTGLIAHVNFSLLYTYLIFCICATICYSFLICAVFSNVNFGSASLCICWFVVYGLATYAVQEKRTVPTIMKYLLLMFPSTGLSFGLVYMFDCIEYDKVVIWSEIFDPVVRSTGMPSLGIIMLMMGANSIFYMVLAWYLDIVFPGEFGIGLPFNFPFKKSFWIVPKEDRSNILLGHLNEKPEVEKVPRSLRVGIQIRNLEKQFTKKKAVDNLNIDIYHNELTVLLGHNGAGKTTTMSIITGMLPPTSGKVLINGYNVQTDMKKIRDSLGFCPQHNIHFPDLTVMQHMKFFAMLKGMTPKEAKAESKKFLSGLNLKRKRHKLASTLSGGQKRRLSLGMALVGGPQVLMLDEPTSGLDPEARREIWDFLLGLRGEHTILITTHYMDEADVLGDRIAIMHHGCLQSYGTSLFLKKFYGTGYVMNLMVNKDADLSAVTTFIQKFVPNATIKFALNQIVTYDLPTSKTAELTELFLQMEAKKIELGITSFGVSITTLEDVFLKVGELAMKGRAHNERHIVDIEDDLSSVTRDFYKKKYTLCTNLLQMCWALLVKRIRYVQHIYVQFCISIIIPTLVALLFSYILTNVKRPIDIYRDLTLSIYAKSDVYYSNQSSTSKIADYYSRIVKRQSSKAIYSQSLPEDILYVAKSNPDKYFHDLVVAADFKDTNMFIALYGTLPLHGPAISLNLITNALLQSSMDDDTYSISVTNQPMTIHTSDKFQITSILNMITWTIILPSTFVAMHSYWINYPQEEYLSGVKHLQIMAGVPGFIYWFMCYIFDLFFHVIYCFIVVILMYNVLANPIFTMTSMEVFMILCVMYGLSAFPMMYLLTRLRTNTATLKLLLVLCLVTGLFGVIVTFLLSWAEYDDASKYIENFLSVSPFYTLTNGMRLWVKHSIDVFKWTSLPDDKKVETCQGDRPFVCCDTESDECKTFMSYYTSEAGLETTLSWIAGQILGYWIILMIFEARYPQIIFDRILERRKRKKEFTDDDVEAEKARVQMQNRDNNTEMLLAKHLRKWYGGLYAVRGLSFGVQKGECFGLLGVNGAGKTTTFKMLTNETSPSTGEVFIKKYKLPSYTYLKQIGYCPQIDALNLSLTARETLTFFARLRGIPFRQTSHEVTKWIEKFGIEKYADKLSGTYSGGNKRKLNTAMALIGKPPLVMLDEPTSGVDPISRHKIWEILGELRKTGQAIVLTSHSMDECEALCDRLTIMVSGQLQCIGPIQYLKQKYGKGFTVMLKLYASDRRSTDGANMRARLKKIFEKQYKCELKDEHHSQLLYHIDNEDIPLGTIFQFMEGLKKSNADILEDYVVSTTSLEEVFLSFAKKRNESSDEPIATTSQA